MRITPKIPIAFATLALLFAFTAGCSTYRDEYRFEPRPVGMIITAPPPASPAQPLEVQASVIGIRSGHPKEHPDTIEVRLRIDNRTPAPAVFIAESLQMVASDLSVFDPPAVEPAEGMHVAPGTVAMVTAYFPLTTHDSHPRQGPLAGMNLRWAMKVGDQPVTCNASFIRRPSYDDGPYGYPSYYDPFWGPRIGVGVRIRH